MTVDDTKHPYLAVGNLAATKVRNRFIATARIHHTPVPRPRGLSVIALSPATGVGPARRGAEATCSWTSSRSSRPSATAAATAAEGGPGKRDQSRGWPRARLDPTARPAIAVRLAGRADERDHAHRPDGPDKAVPPTVGVAGPA